MLLRSRFVLCAVLVFGLIPWPLTISQDLPAAPAFVSLDGTAESLSGLRGRPAVVNFWATWCAPCKEEMPRLQRLADVYTSSGVQFVAISIDGPETRGRVPSVAHARGIRFPVWTGASEATLNSLQLGEVVPVTLVLDAQGKIVGKIEGEAREKDIRSRLDWLLSGGHGKRPPLVQKNDW